MSIEHDEKMPRLSTYSLLSFSTRQLVNSSTTLLLSVFQQEI